MATRNNTITDITRLAKDVATRDLQSKSSEHDPQILSLISAVTDQIKQRSGDNRQLNELVSMIQTAISSKTTTKAAGQSGESA